MENKILFVKDCETYIKEDFNILKNFLNVELTSILNTDCNTDLDNVEMVKCNNLNYFVGKHEIIKDSIHFIISRDNDEPAFCNDSTIEKVFIVNGVVHRDYNRPAIITINNDQHFIINGKYNRTDDGPVGIIKQYYIWRFDDEGKPIYEIERTKELDEIYLYKINLNV